MSEPKLPQKDLTGIIQYAKKMQDAGLAPEAPKGSVMEEVPIEKIDLFESLDAYAAANPTPEPVPEPVFEDTPPTNETANSDQNFETTPGTETPQSDLQDFHSEAPQDASAASATSGSNSGSPAESPPPDQDFAVSEFQISEGGMEGGIAALEGAPEIEGGFAQSEATPSLERAENKGDFSQNNLKQSSHSGAGVEPSTQNSMNFTSTEKLTFKKSSTTPPTHALENVKKYSEQPPPSRSTVPASFPFSVHIQGELRPEEKEKLLSLLEDHKMGFRAIDLEPQLASGRILIPRISEYAGILIIQALRGTRSDMKLGTADSIFSTEATHDTEEESFLSSVDQSTTTYSSELTHPAESIPLTPLDRLPGSPPLTLIDTVTANAALKSTVVEAEHSSAFQEIVEALQREIKYKAYRKGATAVLNFKIQVHNLSSPTHYRILAFGSAVKPAEEQKF